MKPTRLADPRLMIPPLNRVLEKAQEIDPGEIDSLSIDPTFWDPDPFYEHLRDCGYKARKCLRYTPLSLTFVDGACRWHTDPGFGIVACWLVHSDNPFGSDAQLITRHGPLDMRCGDLCVFDSDHGHAWLSNGVCVMVMATITKVRQGVAA